MTFRSLMIPFAFMLLACASSHPLMSHCYCPCHHSHLLLCPPQWHHPPPPLSPSLRRSSSWSPLEFSCRRMYSRELKPKHMYKLILNHIESVTPLVPQQWGFRAGRSTVSALLDATHNWLKAVDVGLWEKYVLISARHSILNKGLLHSHSF